MEPDQKFKEDINDKTEKMKMFLKTCHMGGQYPPEYSRYIFTLKKSILGTNYLLCRGSFQWPGMTDGGAIAVGQWSCPLSLEYFKKMLIDQ